MLYPKWLARCTAPIAELYAQAESSILDDMARRISTYDFYIPAAQYQEEKLAMMGMTRQEIIAELSKRTGKTRQEIQAVMEAGAEETRNSDGAIYERAGKKVPEKISPQMRKIIRSGLKQTAGLFDNLTKTTARTATRQFEKALDLAWLQVSTGAMDPQSAARQAIKGLCKAGIQAIAYPTGHSDTLEVAVTRALRTGVNQTALRMQEQLADEMGSDLVEVTAHAGARPDHAKWQGKVYSLTGRTPGYQTLAKATGYGTGAGLGGWNCRHSFFPHFPGQSNTYSKDELEEYTKPDAVEYHGKKMSLYEAEQTQRSIERNIRRWKRENNAMKAAGLDTTESTAKVKLWNDRYKDFCAKTGLKQQKQRTVSYAHLAQKSVATVGGNGIITGARITDSESPRAVAHAERYYGLVRSMKTDAAKIAKATGYEKKTIQEIKNYLFMEKHDLGDGSVRRFDADFMIAESWRRLMAGNPEAHDLTLLHHEVMERDLVKRGYTQDEAHILTSKKYNYKKEAEKFYDQIAEHRKG